MSIVSIRELDKIKSVYEIQGYVAVSSGFSESEQTELVNIVDAAVEQGKLNYYDESAPTGKTNQDILYTHPIITALCKNKNIVRAVRHLIGRDIELQHAKLTVKPRYKEGLGEVEWHQDYPFFPHSNFGLLACSILLDDEEFDDSPLCFLPGSHKLGVLDHYHPGGDFAYKCTQMPHYKAQDLVNVCLPKGSIVFHHCLTLHRSSPSTGKGRHRRHIVFQYRAKDALQLAGVVRQCNGEPVDDSPCAQTVRFELDELKLIGTRRKLYDPYHKLSQI